MHPTLNKRLKIVYLVMGLAILMAIVLQLPTVWVHWGAIILAIAAYGASVLSMDRDLHREEWVVLPLYSILATIIYFTIASTSIDTLGLTMVAAIGYGLVMYGLLLTLNIINISTVRTIPLIRPAYTVLSMAGLAGSFGLYYLALNNQPPLLNWVLAVGGSTLLIAWPLVWVSLNSKMRFQRSLVWAAFSAMLLMQLAAILSFWPSSFTSDLVLSILLFIILGIFHLQQKRQLNKAIKQQYLLLGSAAALIYILTAQW